LSRYFALLVLMLVPSQALSGYVWITTLLGVTPRWIEAVIPYSVSDAGSPQIPNGSEFLAVAAAFDAWEAVSSANVNFEFQGTTPVRTAGRDRTNLVAFVDDIGLGALLGTTTLAATFSFFNRVGGIARGSAWPTRVRRRHRHRSHSGRELSHSRLLAGKRRAFHLESCFLLLETRSK